MNLNKLGIFQWSPKIKLARRILQKYVTPNQSKIASDQINDYIKNKYIYITKVSF